MKDVASPRLTADERRESILVAATVVFGERGYVGATTDAIAKAAGISQAYVVRMFGSKEELFVAAGRRAADRVIHEFRTTIATFGPDEDLQEKKRAMGIAYSNLVTDRGLLLTLMHFYSLGHDPVFGPLAQATYLNVYRIIRDEAGIPAPLAMEFMARGMLINVLMALRMPEIAGDQPDALELLGSVFDGKEDQVIAMAHLQPRLGSGRRG